MSSTRKGWAEAFEDERADGRKQPWKAATFKQVLVAEPTTKSDTAGAHDQILVETQRTNQLQCSGYSGGIPRQTVADLEAQLFNKA